MNTIKDYCNLLNGYSFKSDKYVDKGIRVVRITNVQKGEFVDADPKYYPLSEEKEIQDYLLQENDLLISLTGNVGRVCKISKDYLPAGLNQRVACLRIKNKKLLKDYLYFYLMRNQFENDCINNSKGIAQLNLSTIWLENYPINVPSLEKQEVIVKSLSKISKNIADLKESLESLNELTKSRFIEMFGNPLTNDKNWNRDELQNLVVPDCTISYGIVQTGDDVENGVPVFRPIDIVNNIPNRETLKKTSAEISNRYKKTILKGRELLITVRANIADVFVTNEEFEGCNVGRGITPIRTNENIINLDFLKLQIENEDMNSYIKSLANGIALIQLNMSDLRKIKFIIPPIEKQIEYVDFTKQIDKLKFTKNEQHLHCPS